MKKSSILACLLLCTLLFTACGSTSDIFLQSSSAAVSSVRSASASSMPTLSLGTLTARSVQENWGYSDESGENYFIVSLRNNGTAIIFSSYYNYNGTFTVEGNQVTFVSTERNTPYYLRGDEPDAESIVTEEITQTFVFVIEENGLEPANPETELPFITVTFISGDPVFEGYQLGVPYQCEEQWG